MEELTRQNQEIKLQLQQEENRSPIRVWTNRNNDEDSHKRDDYRQSNSSDKANLDLLRDMRKEMDELRNAMREKMDQNLDGMVRRTDSPFTAKVLECPLLSKFRLPQLESFDGLKDPLDHIITFKTTLSLQQPPDKILCRSFPTTLKGAARVWFSKLTSFIDNFKQLGNSFVRHFVGGQHQKRLVDHLLTIRQGEKEPLRSYVKRFTREVLELIKRMTRYS